MAIKFFINERFVGDKSGVYRNEWRQVNARTLKGAKSASVRMIDCKAFDAVVGAMKKDGTITEIAVKDFDLGWLDHYRAFKYVK